MNHDTVCTQSYRRSAHLVGLVAALGAGCFSAGSEGGGAPPNSGLGGLGGASGKGGSVPGPRTVSCNDGAGQAPIAGDGQVTSKSFPLTGFQRIDAGCAFAVDIQPGPFAVTVSLDRNLHDKLDVRVDGAELVLDFRGSAKLSAGALHAKVTLPTLAGLELRGASTASLADVPSGGTFDLSTAGATAVDGRVTATRLVGAVVGAGTLDLAGSASELELRVEGAAAAQLAELPVASARVEAHGASDVDITVTGKLDATATGVSAIRYGGGATLGQILAVGLASIQPR